MTRARDKSPTLVRLFGAVAHLPLGFLHACGVVLGWAAYLLSPAYRRRVRENVRLAYPDGGAAIVCGAIGHAGRGVAELPYVWLRPRRESLALVRQVIGWDLVMAARSRGDGIIVLTPHLGCFELIAQYMAREAAFTALYRSPKRPWLRPLLEIGRGGDDITLAPADLSGVRRLIRALRRGEAIGMLPDQVPGKGDGEWADFFGRPAYTMTLAARLTELPHTTPVFALSERLPGGRGFHLYFEEPPESIAGSTGERVAAINRCIEALIRRFPAQYLWGYNRYKRPASAEPPPSRPS